MKSVYKAKKNRRTSFVILKVIFTFCIILALYFQLKNRDLNSWQFESSSIFLLIIGALLVPLNWMMEFLKWRLCLKQIGIDNDRRLSINSFYAGFVTGFLTPSMSGNFIGRMYYFEREDRGAIILFSLLSGLAQFIITLIMGMLAIAIIGEILGIAKTNLLYYTVILSIPFSIISYFFLEYLLRIFKSKRSMIRLSELLNGSIKFRFDLLVLSLIRYVIFTVQYVIVLRAFGAEYSWELVAGVAQLFLVTTLIPSAFMGKLGIRESVGLILLGSLGITEPIILFSSLTVWLFNLLLPTLFSVLIVRRIS